MSKRLFFLLTLCIVSTAAPLSVSAQKDIFVDQVRITDNTVINDNFVRFGDEVTINGTVNGDVITAGNIITINGTVNGDVLAAANTIEINGPVTGNVRVIGESVTITSAVAKNATIAGQTITLTKDASIGWTLSFIGKTVNINGTVNGNVYGYGDQIAVRGLIGNNATFFFDKDGQGTIDESGIINGNLEYHSEHNIAIASGALIGGTTTQKAALWEEHDSMISRIYGKLIGLFGLLLVGTIIISLLPGPIRQFTRNLLNKPLTKILWGLLVLLAVPLLVLIMAITIIGIPLAVILGVFYAIALYISPVFIGTAIGQKIILLLQGKYKQTEPRTTPLIWMMMLGTVIIFLFRQIPTLGALTDLVSIVWFLGALSALIIKKLNYQKNAPSQ